ncbi:MAG TPA: hypothetical protein VFA22_09100 [Stellaceae bacterium]|nr:hypothetical protein [Stellaceae bacterium]
MSIASTIGYAHSTTGRRRPSRARDWHGIALYCAVMAVLLCIGIATGGLSQPSDPATTFVAP